MRKGEWSRVDLSMPGEVGPEGERFARRLARPKAGLFEHRELMLGSNRYQPIACDRPVATGPCAMGRLR